MSQVYFIIGISVGVLSAISWIVNIGILVITCWYKKLRELSVGGLIMIASLNDVFMCMFAFTTLLQSYRSTFNIHTTWYCSVEQMGTFSIIELPKAVLLILSIDRIYAMYRPIKYQQRNHARFATITGVVIYGQAGLTLVYGISIANWSSEVMNELCFVTTAFEAEPITAVLLSTVVSDLATYALNGVLLYSVLKSPKIKPVSSSAVGHAAAEQRRRQRQSAITNSVLSAVGVHFLFTTVPFIFMVIANEMLVAGEITSNTFNIVESSGSFVSVLESLANVYVYVTKMPHYKGIVSKLVGWHKFKTIMVKPTTQTTKTGQK